MDGKFFSRTQTSKIEPALTVAQLRHYLSTGRAITLLDVRREPAWRADPRGLPGALRVDPSDLEDGLCGLPRRGLVVAYCLRGGPVSRYAVHILRGAGFDAWFLAGGRDAWIAAGGELQPPATMHRLELAS